MAHGRLTLGMLLGVILGVGTAVAVAIGTTNDGGPSAAGTPLAERQIVDLTYAFDADAVYWPTAPHGFRHEPLSVGETEGGWFYSAFTVSAPEHGGTHMDAPYHFAREGRAADAVRLERLIGPAVVIDVSAQAAEDRDYRLQPDDLRAFEETHGRIPEDAIVLLRTGWAEHWPDVEAYLGGTDADALHFPSFGEAAVRLLIEERGIAAIGVDTASTDAGSARDFPVHRLASKHDVPGFENLANLEALPPSGAIVAALPMKIAGGSGAPLRAVAFVPKGSKRP